MNYQFNAWAINTMSEEGHSWLGRYWRFKDMPPRLPEHMEGCHVALFKTRKIARENLKSVRGEPNDGKFYAFPKARVERVRITIDTIK